MARAKPTAVRKPRSRDAEASTELEVEEAAPAEEQVAKPPMGLENALVLVTFVALAVAFVLIEMRSKSAHGGGLIF